MATMEQLELDSHRAQLAADVERLVDKYRAIFEWDVPDLDEPRADALIVASIRQALVRIEQALPGAMQA